MSEFKKVFINASKTEVMGLSNMISNIPVDFEDLKEVVRRAESCNSS